MDRRGKYFYNMSRLNRIFAVSSLILFISMAWMVWDDYNRPFKGYQREFFRLAAERSRAALQAEQEKLEKEGELERLEADLARAEEALSSREQELARENESLEALEARFHREEQDYSFAKSILDTRRFEFENSREIHGAEHEESRRAAEAWVRAREAAEASRRLHEGLLLEKRAASILQFALGRVGGILEAKKIAGIAEAHYAELAPHLYCGPIEAAANIQIDACCPNFLIQESIETWGGFHAEILKEPIQWEDGYIIPSTKPGLGVELNEEVAAKHPYKPL